MISIRLFDVWVLNKSRVITLRRNVYSAVSACVRRVTHPMYMHKQQHPYIVLVYLPWRSLVCTCVCRLTLGTAAGLSPATSASSLRGSVGMARYSSFDSVHSTTSSSGGVAANSRGASTSAASLVRCGTHWCTLVPR